MFRSKLFKESIKLALLSLRYGQHYSVLTRRGNLEEDSNREKVLGEHRKETAAYKRESEKERERGGGSEEINPIYALMPDSLPPVL